VKQEDKKNKNVLARGGHVKKQNKNITLAHARDCFSANVGMPCIKRDR